MHTFSCPRCGSYQVIWRGKAANGTQRDRLHQLELV
ncbi:MAG: hypothetical protein H0X65_20770 [Gemmatimonadetes bacterium]|nr:hypothetical protein [Gemmatimonadota bacterium]